MPVPSEFEPQAAALPIPELNRRTLLAGGAVTAATIGLSRLAVAKDKSPEPKTAGELRIGDPIGPITLRDAGTRLEWDSTLLLGQRSWLAIIDAAAPQYALTEAVASAAKAAGDKGANVVIISPPRKGKDVVLAPEPIVTLTSEGKAPALATAPAFVAVDRAGWVRELEALPTAKDDADSVQLRYLLAKVGDPTPPLEEGKAAPDFSFRDFHGFWRRPSALRGRRNLLITFFPKCFTGRCKTHLSSLRDSQPGFIAANTDVWAVSVDPAGGERGQLEFAKFINLPYPMLPDEGRNVCLLYGAAQAPNQLALRQSVLIDRDGVVRWIDRAINPETHGQDVLVKINALGLG
jgi:peroxiredoxin